MLHAVRYCIMFVYVCVQVCTRVHTYAHICTVQRVSMSVLLYIQMHVDADGTKHSATSWQVDMQLCAITVHPRSTVTAEQHKTTHNSIRKHQITSGNTKQHVATTIAHMSKHMHWYMHACMNTCMPAFMHTPIQRELELVNKWVFECDKLGLEDSLEDRRREQSHCNQLTV